MTGFSRSSRGMTVFNERYFNRNVTSSRPEKLATGRDDGRGYAARCITANNGEMRATLSFFLQLRQRELTAIYLPQERHSAHEF